jgi:hypothetical protein
MARPYFLVKMRSNTPPSLKCAGGVFDRIFTRK